MPLPLKPPTRCAVTAACPTAPARAGHSSGPFQHSMAPGRTPCSATDTQEARPSPHSWCQSRSRRCRAQLLPPVLSRLALSSDGRVPGSLQCPRLPPAAPPPLPPPPPPSCGPSPASLGAMPGPGLIPPGCPSCTAPVWAPCDLLEASRKARRVRTSSASCSRLVPAEPPLLALAPALARALDLGPALGHGLAVPVLGAGRGQEGQLIYWRRPPSAAWPSAPADEPPCRPLRPRHRPPPSAAPPLSPPPP